MARRVPPREAADALRRLQDLVRAPGNRHCADCGDRSPNHVVLSLGTFVCSVCAGVHRDANRRGVRNIDTATFGMEDAYRMEDRGNELARKRWMARWSPRDFPEPEPGDVEKIREFIWLKYDGSWASKSISSTPAPVVRDIGRRDPRDEVRRDPRDRDRDYDRDRAPARGGYRERERDYRPIDREREYVRSDRDRRAPRYPDDVDEYDDGYRRRVPQGMKKSKKDKKKSSKKTSKKSSKYESSDSEEDSEESSEEDSSEESSSEEEDRRRSKKSSRKSKKKDKKKSSKSSKKKEKSARPAFAGSIDDLIQQNAGSSAGAAGMQSGFGQVVQTPMGPAVMTPQGLMPPAMAAQMMGGGMGNGMMGGMNGMGGGMNGMGGGMNGMGGGMNGMGGGMNGMGGGMNGMGGGMNGMMGGMNGMGGGAGGGMAMNGMGDMSGMGMGGMGMGGGDAQRGMGGGKQMLALPAPPSAADQDVMGSLGPIQTLNISESPATNGTGMGMMGGGMQSGMGMGMQAGGMGMQGGGMGMQGGGMGMQGGGMGMQGGGMGMQGGGMGMQGGGMSMQGGMASAAASGGGDANPFGGANGAGASSTNPFDDF